MKKNKNMTVKKQTKKTPVVKTKVKSKAKVKKVARKVTVKKAAPKTTTKKTVVRKSASRALHKKIHSRVLSEPRDTSQFAHVVYRRRKVSVVRIAILFFILAATIAIFIWAFAKRSEAPIIETSTPSKMMGMRTKQLRLENQSFGMHMNYPARLVMQQTSEDQGAMQLIFRGNETNSAIVMRAARYDGVPSQAFPYGTVESYFDTNKADFDGITVTPGNTQWRCMHTAEIRRCLSQKDARIYELEYPINQQNPLNAGEFDRIVAGAEVQ